MSDLVDRPDLSRRVFSHERVWSGPIFAMDNDLIALSDDVEPIARQYLAHYGAVAVVALREGQESAQPDGAPEVLLIHQYRHPVRAQLWEITAGLLDAPGENPLLAAQRELLEETDYQAKRWDVLVDFFSSPGCSTEGLRVFLARDVHLVEGDTGYTREDEEAEMETAWVPLDEALQAILGGEMHSPSAVVGLLALSEARRRNWETLRAPDAPWLRSPGGFQTS